MPTVLFWAGLIVLLYYIIGFVVARVATKSRVDITYKPVFFLIPLLLFAAAGLAKYLNL